MTPEQFCYWLQGRAEMQPTNAPSESEWAIIGAHLQTVFHKVTPQVKQFGGQTSFEEQMRRMHEQNKTVVSPGWYQQPQNIC